MLDVQLLTTCGLSVMKVCIQEQSEELSPRLLSLVSSLWGTMELKAKL